MFLKSRPDVDKDLSRPELHDFCKQQAARFKFADNKLANHSLDEKVTLLPLQLLRFIFKHQIGVCPYEVEDTTGQQQLYYNSFEISQKIKEIDRDFIAIMSGTKFNNFGSADSPKRIKFMNDKLSTDFGLKQMHRVESDFLEQQH